MNKIQQDVEQYIRHLQSSLDKRKRDINAYAEMVRRQKANATIHYNNNEGGWYKKSMILVEYVQKSLKQLHKEQSTETRMLKFFENARSFAIALENTK